MTAYPLAPGCLGGPVYGGGSPVPYTPTVAPADFRADFPAFADDQTFADDAINFWIGIASLQLSQRWSTIPAAIPSPSGLTRSIRDLGVELFVAHEITLEYYAQQQAANGAPPTGQSGVQSSRGVGPTSLSFDVGSTVNPNDGHWNLTIYGRRFARIARYVGMGPIHLGGGFVPPYFTTAQAWVGPWPLPWLFG